MADKVLARLKTLGADARLIPVEGGAPVVYGEIGSGPRTLMIYDHYDVQPAEPLELWESGPWEAAIRDGKLFARGVADNKGNLLCRIQAIESYLATIGPLPLKIKFVVEGEEEIGSIHLPQFVEENRALLEGADGCLWEFGGKDINERPELTCGLKGIVYVELHAHGAKRDIHSAMAAIVVDPAWRLTWALATLKDENDHILIDDFHAATSARRLPPRWRRSRVSRSTRKRKRPIWAFRPLSAISPGWSCSRNICTSRPARFAVCIRATSAKAPRPCCRITRLPRLTFAWCPNLTPELVVELLRKHLDRRGFTDIEIRLTETGEEVARSPLDSAIVRAAYEASQAVNPNEPVIVPTSAGSGPMYPLCQALGIPAVCAGVRLA